MAAEEQTEQALQALLEPAKRQPAGRSGDLRHAPEVRCVDGLSFSMQASKFHYCQPRNDSGPWSSVEIGFPSRRVDEFMPFIDGKDEDPTGTVYGYVPLATVAAVVDAAGGLTEKAA